MEMDGVVSSKSGERIKTDYLPVFLAFVSGLGIFGCGDLLGTALNPVTITWTIIAASLTIFLLLPLLAKINPISHFVERIPRPVALIMQWVVLIGYAFLLGLGLGANSSALQKDIPIWNWLLITGIILTGLFLLVYFTRSLWHVKAVQLLRLEGGLGIVSLCVLLAVAFLSWQFGRPAPVWVMTLILACMALAVVLGLARLADKQENSLRDAAGVLYVCLGILLLLAFQLL
jgi:hypothetical protein